jgi:predicted transcriptional regulator of viral defense system
LGLNLGPVPELIHLASTPRTSDGSVRDVAERQWGVISRSQLLACGLSEARVARWIETGRLQRIHPSVYAFGHRALKIEGMLQAALLYAGPRAVLSHTTAAWWWQLIPAEPARIHVSSADRHRSLRNVRVHRPRRPQRVLHRGLPVTTVARTMLDLAAVLPFPQLRRAVAEAEYLRLLDLRKVEQILGRGRPGSSALRRALEDFNPDLALTLSVLEERFIELCESNGIPLPEVNEKVQGFTVDALWRERNLIVELDGHRAHATPTAIERDRHRELALRASGYRVLRYTWKQVTSQPDLVASDLRRALGII